ncbi:MAG: Na+/H+ antiporter NhaC [Synergistaceae bacterium]|nr:Na+/H+ antiporter NhaC [Synergistaceae bacterium]
MKDSTRRLPSITEAIIYLTLIIGVIIAGLWLIGARNGGAPMSLFLGAIISTLIALFLHNKWKDIQNEMIKVISDSLVAVIIIMIVGMTIGVWMIGGTIPALIYYGLKVCTPGNMLPLTFILCAFASTFTGTSFGTMATMGLALVGVGLGLGMPPHIVAGAAVAGAYFGDKMSPMSDTTNMAPAMSGTTLYEHIFSMLYTTVPATVVCLIIYALIGNQYASGVMDDSNIVIISEGLRAKFSITPFALIPALLVLVIAAFKIPAILGLGVCFIISVIFAMILQGAGFVPIIQTAFSGFKSETGVNIVDTLLNRGGLRMVQDTVCLILLACLMGGALNQSGILNVFAEKGVLKVAKKPFQLVLGTMVYCYSILLLSGNQVLGIILGGRTFQEAYKEMDVHPKVLSRTLEDTNTIASALVPWSTASIYACSVMGVSIAYIPYAFLGFIVPIFTVLLAFTGYGMWRSDGTPMWGKKAKKQN